MKLSRYKHDSSFSYAFGATLTYELAQTHPQLIQRVFLRPNIKHGTDLERILTLLNRLSIQVIESTKAFNILGAKDNCLLLAEFKKPQTELSWTPEAPHIVLVNPSDAGNLGTIMRTAAAFGYQDIAIITPAVDVYDPKTVRASMGSIFHINIETFKSFEEYLAKYGHLKEESNAKRALYSFMLNPNAQTLTEVCPQNTYYALIFGNEASGLPEDYSTKTHPIYIQQSSAVDSLNLSVAASIAMFDFREKLQKISP